MNSQTLKGAVALFIAATLAACAVGPNYKKPETPVAQTYGAAEPALYTPEQAQVQFWKQFGDETLDKLVDDSLNANHDLRMALGRLVEARALRREARHQGPPRLHTARRGDGSARQRRLRRQPRRRPREHRGADQGAHRHGYGEPMKRIGKLVSS